MAGRARHVTGGVSTAECLMIPGAVEEQTFRPKWGRVQSGCMEVGPPGRERTGPRPGSVASGPVGSQRACSGHGPAFAFSGPALSLEGLHHSAGCGKLCGRKCAQEQQVEVPMRGPKNGGPDAVLGCPRFPAELPEGRGGQTCLCLPRTQSQGNARQADFNSEPYCQLTFPVGLYAPGDLPALTYYSPQPCRQGREGNGEPEGLSTLPEIPPLGSGRATRTGAVGPAVFTSTPPGDASAYTKLSVL